MKAVRLFVLTAAIATLATPLAVGAAPGSDAQSACNVPAGSLVERRIQAEAARGLPALIGFVHRTAPIYQLSVVDAVAWVDSERKRRATCLRASADKLAD